MGATHPPKAISERRTHATSIPAAAGVAAGWWQGHEAWSNLCAGAPWASVYGAASLWQWRLHPDEPGPRAVLPGRDAGWREALDFEGAATSDWSGRILDGLPLAHLRPCWDVSTTTRGLLDPGVLYIGYAEHGGPWVFLDAESGSPPVTGSSTPAPGTS